MLAAQNEPEHHQTTGSVFSNDEVRHVGTVDFLFRAQTQYRNLNMKTSPVLHLTLANLQECAAAGHIDHPAKQFEVA